MKLHFERVTAVPNWDPRGIVLDHDELEAAAQRGRVLRARAFGAFGRRGAHLIARIARAIVGAAGLYRRRQGAYKSLMGLDDRTLRDIGIERSAIPAIADHLARRDNGATGVEVAPAAILDGPALTSCSVGRLPAHGRCAGANDDAPGPDRSGSRAA